MRNLLGLLLQEVLDWDYEQFLGAGPYERSQDRKSYQNDYYQQEVLTRTGSIGFDLFAEEAPSTNMDEK
jgi:transposase-like protein